MITRFDHAVIAVRDLDAAMAAYRALGFAVSPGGRHPGQGTQNAIIRFGLDYLELLAVADEGEAQAQGLNRRALLEFLRDSGGGLAGYALASDDIIADAERMRAAGMEVEGPFAMRRQRPDGSVLAWRLAVPGGTPWRRPWPFLIAWDTPDDERLARERPGAHANGIARVAGVAVLVRTQQGARDIYERALGLALRDEGVAPEPADRRTTASVDDTEIEALVPRGAGPINSALASLGEGPFEVLLGTRDLAAARRFFVAAGIALSEIPERPGALLIAPEAALGARLVIVPAS